MQAKQVIFKYNDKHTEARIKIKNKNNANFLDIFPLAIGLLHF